MEVRCRRHVWRLLWSHFGQYGPQDKHFHSCLNAECGCGALLVGPSHDCNGKWADHKIDRSHLKAGSNQGV